MNNYFLYGNRNALILSKKSLDETIELFKEKDVKFKKIEEREEELGLWLETKEEILLEEGDIVNKNKRSYMRYDNKNLKFYYPDEILELKNLSKNDAEENLVIIYKDAIEYVGYEIECESKQISFL